MKSLIRTLLFPVAVLGLCALGLSSCAPFPAAARPYKAAAERHDPVAQYKVGKAYLEQKKQARLSRESAVSWFRKAAANGNSDAMVALAECYADGLGTRPDDDMCREWANRALAAGNVRGGNFAMGRYFLTDRSGAMAPGTAIKYFQTAGEDWDNYRGAYYLALSHDYYAKERLREGAPRSEWLPLFGKAVQYYQKAAAHGVTDAFGEAAMIYYELGDYSKAADYAQRAATLRIPSGLAAQGWLKLEGKAVRQNTDHAAKLFLAAADAGDANGCLGVGTVFAARASGYAYAVPYLRRAMDKGGVRIYIAAQEVLSDID